MSTGRLSTQIVKVWSTEAENAYHLIRTYHDYALEQITEGDKDRAQLYLELIENRAAIAQNALTSAEKRLNYIRSTTSHIPSGDISEAAREKLDHQAEITRSLRYIKSIMAEIRTMQAAIESKINTAPPIYTWYKIGEGPLEKEKIFLPRICDYCPAHATHYRFAKPAIGNQYKPHIDLVLCPVHLAKHAKDPIQKGEQ